MDLFNHYSVQKNKLERAFGRTWNWWLVVCVIIIYFNILVIFHLVIFQFFSSLCGASGGNDKHSKSIVCVCVLIRLQLRNKGSPSNATKIKLSAFCRYWFLLCPPLHQGARNSEALLASFQHPPVKVPSKYDRFTVAVCCAFFKAGKYIYIHIYIWYEISTAVLGVKKVE